MSIAAAERAEEKRRILKALDEGARTTAEVRAKIKLGISLDRVRSKLRYLEALGLVKYDMVIGPPGFCTFLWSMTAAGEKALAHSTSEER